MASERYWYLRHLKLVGLGLHPLCICIPFNLSLFCPEHLTFHSAQFLFYLHPSMNYSREFLDSGLAHTQSGSCVPDLGGSVSIRNHTFTSFV